MSPAAGIAGNISRKSRFAGCFQMIYMLGMSHLEPVLDVISANGLAEQLWKIRGAEEPAFTDWDIKPEILPDRVKATSIYIRQTGPHWGMVPAVEIQPSIVGMVSGFRKLLESIDGTDARTTLFVFMYGEEHVHMSRRQHDVPYDFYLPWRPDLPVLPHRQVVPLDVVEKEVAHYLAKAKANFMAIRACWPGLRVVNVVCPPPPAVDVEVEVGPEDLASSVPNNYPARLKYYLLYTKTLNEAVLPLGIESLMPPPDTLDTEGFLLAQYAHDGVHGNAGYGNRVLAQINEVFQAGAR
jgi:hypothetical protein